tara:strand:+ start:2804 stop:3457 length:654 start_codon:yes stop_codon:yes gene_type:complete
MKKGFEIAADLTEVIVKSQLLTGIAKDIPYVSTLLKALNLGDSIRDRMFAAKVMRFLESLDDVTGKERDEMSGKIKYVNQDELNNVTDKILFCIDSTTDIDKSEFIANLFIAYIHEKISEKDLRRCIDIIQATFLDDLKAFVITDFLKGSNIKDKDLVEQGLENLKSSILFSSFVPSQAQFGGSLTSNRQSFTRTPIANTFLKAFHFGRKYREFENS